MLVTARPSRIDRAIQPGEGRFGFLERGEDRLIERRDEPAAIACFLAAPLLALGAGSN